MQQERLFRNVCNLAVVIILTQVAEGVATDTPVVSFKEQPDRLQIAIGGKPFATYVYRDRQTLRPYFCNVFAPNGLQATRHHPPRTGRDSTDHATMHPGIWLAFGDINGADFWRNRAQVRHIEFVAKPKGGAGQGTFTVRNHYVSNQKVVCTEICRHSILVRPAGYLLLYDSRFQGSDGSFYFGDQEEMGLGVRVAAALRVRGGDGQIKNSDGLLNESQVWGKQSDWCDYSGVIDEQRVGFVLMPHPKNFRRSWFHARDYGFVAANPFGRNAFTGKAKSKVIVQSGKALRLRFGVLIYSVSQGDRVDRNAAYKDFLHVLDSAA